MMCNFTEWREKAEQGTGLMTAAILYWEETIENRQDQSWTRLEAELKRYNKAQRDDGRKQTLYK